MDKFPTFFIGGFECSSHRNATRRVDVLAASKHDIFAREDYERLRRVGISTAREGLRWHLIERAPGVFDFSSVERMLEAARQESILVIWDLLHYGWPDDVDVFSDAFVTRFSAFARAFANFWLQHRAPGSILWICPVNEISFLAWAGAETAYINPFARDRADEFKRQLVRAALAGAKAVLETEPTARLAQIEPLIHIVPNKDLPERAVGIAGYNNAQFQAWDMLGGGMSPELGGDKKYLDVLGVNYYPKNQWVDCGETLSPTDSFYKPFRYLLQEVFERYQRPIFVAETGTEDDARVAWLTYVCEETIAAMELGVPVLGLCLYPILNHPGWDDDRHCYNGLWDYADELGRREMYSPLARVIEHYAKKFELLHS